MTISENPIQNIPPQASSEEILKQEILDLKIPEIDSIGDITPELLEKYTSWRQTNEKLDTLQAGSALSLAQFEEILEKERQEENQGVDIQAATQEALDSAVQSTTEALEDTPEAVANFAGDKVTQQINTALQENIPFGLGEKFGGFGEAIGTLIKQVLTTLTGAFGGLGITKWLKERFGWGEAETSDSGYVAETNTEIPANNEGSIEEVVAINQESLNPDYGKNRFYIGSRLILELNGSMQDFSTLDHTTTSEGLKGMTYSEILSLNSSNIPQNFYSQENDTQKNREFYTYSINALQSSTTQDLLRIGLKNESLERILLPYGEVNTKLAPQFGETEEKGLERLNEIIEKFKNGSLDWKTDLTYKEISILYLASFPALKIPAIVGLESMGNDLQTLFFGESGVIEDYGNSPISSEFLSAMSGLGTSALSNPSIQEFQEASQKEIILNEVDEEHKEQVAQEFEKLMEFKKYILSEDFYENPKLGLTPEEQQSFLENISLAHIVILQGILGADGRLDNISPLAIPPLIYTIGKILGRGGSDNTLESSTYMGRYVKDAILNSDGIFSEDENTVLKIYGHKILDVILLSHVNSMISLLGGTQGFTGIDLDTLTIGTLVGSGAVRFTGVRMIRRALKADNISLGGVWLKRAGNIGLLAGVALGGVNWYTKNQSESYISRDIESAQESEDILKIIEVLQKQIDAIKTVQLTNGTEVKIFAYPGDEPFYVIDGKIFQLKTGGLNILEQWELSNKSGEDAWNIGKETLLGFFSERTGTVGNIDYTSQRYENGDIIFGSGEEEVRFSIEEIISESTLAKPEILGEDIMRQISQGERGLNILGFNIGDEGQQGYLLGKLDENTVMFLSEVGSIDDLFIPPTENS